MPFLQNIAESPVRSLYVEIAARRASHSNPKALLLWEARLAAILWEARLAAILWEARLAAISCTKLQTSRIKVD